jgi:hypothetical protein
VNQVNLPQLASRSASTTTAILHMCSYR